MDKKSGFTNYDPKKIEKKWIDIWEENKIYKIGNLDELDKTKKKMNVLDMFPYPSGEGLHAGHSKIFSASDIYSRFKRLQGYNVMHVQGFDAFGLPAEQFAIKNKINPRISTAKNIENFERQMKSLGLSYDWDRRVSTTDPEFYKWTQWIFKQLYKAGLVYESYEPINWCPSCKTGLANEDLENGLCERCGSVVEKKPLRQWSIKITEYAEKLLSGLEDLDWKENIKEMQRNWIGKSTGAEIEFILKGNNTEDRFTVFTTRPDTLYGCTYCVLAPEHKLVQKLLNEQDTALLINKNEVKKYIEDSKNKTEIERTALGKEKTGVKLEGIVVVNPANNKEVPVYIADYVLGNYGTGAIMAVPAHDERDFEFAKKYNIEIIESVRPCVVDHINTPRPEFKTTIRNNVHAIVFDAKKNKYLILRNKEHNWDTVVIGGIEDGENPQEAARREVLEETGYKNLKFIKVLGNPVQAGYFAKHKNENRLAISTAVYFELENEETEKFEDEGNEILWIDKKDFVVGKMVNSELGIWLERMNSDAEIPFCGNGVLVNSGEFDGMSSEDAGKKIVEKVQGKMVKKYKLRDWVFARQRYWGEPFPIVFSGGIDNLKIEEKTFIDNESESKVREDKEWVERDAITAVVKHPSENKFIGLKWKKVNWGTYVTGGIEEGQTAEGAAQIEVTEETGYFNFKKTKNLGLIHSKFFHNPKNVNRFAHINIIYIKLENLDQKRVDDAENESHEVVWLDENELDNFLTPEAHKYVFQQLKINQRKSYLVADKCLPVVLPDVESYEPTGNGESPLANINEFVKVKGIINPEGEFETDESGEIFYRETNTMPQWAGSSWYWLRYLDPKNENEFVSKEIERYWSSNGNTVDMYLGGLEHATRHLIYARFWNQILFDQGYLSQPEPFKRLEAVGLILGEDGQKMSKRTGNVVNPDDVIEMWGADTLRLYIAFAGDYHDSFSWDSKAIVGPRRFIERVWNLQNKIITTENNEEFEVVMNQTIKKVENDFELLKLNTAVAQMMICVNEIEKSEGISLENYKKLLILISPLCPFFTEEVWENLKQVGSIHKASWPKYDQTKLLEKTVSIALQINGKLREVFVCETDLEDEKVLEIAKNTESYKKWVDVKTPKKEIVVKNKIVNIVL